MTFPLTIRRLPCSRVVLPRARWLPQRPPSRPIIHHRQAVFVVAFHDLDGVFEVIAGAQHWRVEPGNISGIDQMIEFRIERYPPQRRKGEGPNEPGIGVDDKKVTVVGILHRLVDKRGCFLLGEKIPSASCAARPHPAPPSRRAPPRTVPPGGCPGFGQAPRYFFEKCVWQFRVDKNIPAGRQHVCV